MNLQQTSSILTVNVSVPLLTQSYSLILIDLQIIQVRPSSEEEVQGKPSKIPENMPIASQKYHAGNDVNVFVFSKPIKKAATSTNEFKVYLHCSNVWNFIDMLCRTSGYKTLIISVKIHSLQLTCKSSLTCCDILTFWQIVKRVTTELNPIQTAHKAVKDKNMEIRELSVKHSDPACTAPVSDFAMVLQGNFIHHVDVWRVELCEGAIFAAVNGGALENYRDAFFNAQYERENPDKIPWIKLLKEELTAQLGLLQDGLVIYKNKCTPEMAGLQQLLEGNNSRLNITLKNTLSEKFAEMKNAAKSIIN
jgi:hypothetical protein